MNRQDTIRLISRTFKNPFDETRFARFACELLNDLDVSETARFSRKGVYVHRSKAYQEYVRRYDRLGKYTDSQGYRLDVLVVYLKKPSNLERARTMQRNFVADYLRAKGEKDAALVAYAADGEANWRFSFVRMDYQRRVDEATGKVKITEKLTPARRFSFLVGAEEPNHTAQQQLLPILRDDAHNPTLDQLEEAFSIEKVSKAFFDHYKARFLELVDELGRIRAQDPAVGREFSQKGLDTAQFAKKLLGQIVFLYFLQKKGWLGVEKGRPWGSGPKNFLSALFCIAEKKLSFSEKFNFFNDVLEPLFYEALAIRRSGNWYPRLKCKIPFLNGGLFEPLGGYDWRGTEISIDNTVFEKIFETFDLYNFTVREDEPLEKEVAVDPEMLGKVFERLLEVRDRKSKGAFYTPREIVHYMCQESLINYLDTAVNLRPDPLVEKPPVQADLFSGEPPRQEVLTGTKYEPVLPRADIEILVRKGDLALQHEAAREAGAKSYAALIPESVRARAADLDAALADIKVCDPAVGSGAFPVGMMHEIVRARLALTPYLPSLHGRGNGGEGERTPYAFKRHAIQESLYGVDIDPAAVDIAKLRLWLSLVVDEENYADIKPLPNLDYKIVAGNSLLGYPYQRGGLEKLEALKDEFFDETDPKKKQALREQIDQELAEIFKNTKRSLGYQVTFDFRINFSEVFRKNSNLDIIIGNPPYNAKLSDWERRHYKNNYESVKKGRQDTAAIFVELGRQIGNSSSQINYILPFRLLSRRRNHGQFQIWTLNHLTLADIIYIGTNVGFSANDEFMILRALPAPPGDAEIRVAFKPDIKHFSTSLEFYTIAQSAFADRGEININLLRYDVDLLNKIESGSSTVQLGTICNVRDGIVPYLRDKLISPTKLDHRYVRFAGVAGRYVIRKYYFRCDELYLCYDINEARKYISDKKELRKVQLRDKEIFLSRKIITAQDSITLKGTIDEDQIFVSNSIHSTYLKPEYQEMVSLEYILGLVNSKLLNYYHNSLRTKATDLHPQVLISDLKKLPIRMVMSDEQRSVVDLVRKIIKLKRQNPDADSSALEAKIDRLVYQLYNLTGDEIALVEGKESK